MNWQDIVKTVAPAIGTAVGGPLVGTAVKLLSGAIFGRDDATQDEVQAAVESGLPAEVIVKIKELDTTFKLQMAQIGVDLERLGLEKEKVFVEDTNNARTAAAGNHSIHYLGVWILATFALVTVLVLYGCFQMLTGGIPIKDPSVVAAVFSLLGSVVGYIAANAQQVVSFNFGSSRGSEAKTTAMTDAIKGFAPSR